MRRTEQYRSVLPRVRIAHSFSFSLFRLSVGTGRRWPALLFFPDSRSNLTQHQSLRCKNARREKHAPKNPRCYTQPVLGRSHIRNHQDGAIRRGSTTEPAKSKPPGPAEVPCLRPTRGLYQDESWHDPPSNCPIRGSSTAKNC